MGGMKSELDALSEKMDLHVTTVNEQVYTNESCLLDMDDVYHCNAKKLFDEILQLNESYSTTNSKLKVYSEQVVALSYGQRDMDGVYHCNIKKLSNEIQQLNKRYSIMK